MKTPLPLLVIGLLFPVACEPGNKSTVTGTDPDSEEKSCCSELPSAADFKPGAESVYQVESKWHDQTGKERTLKSLAGRVQVVTMGYTTCKFACPRLLADMRQIEAGLPDKVASETGFVFVSIDPERDTPSRLAGYEKENKLDRSRWTLLTGDTPSVQELAVVFGIQYRKVADTTDFAHSNLILVLNAKGEIIHRQEGLGADPAATVKAILDEQG